MSPCPETARCTFFQTVEPSIMKRIKYASSFPYCKGNQHQSCSLYPLVVTGAEIPANLTPNGVVGDYMDDHNVVHAGSGHHFLVVEDSPVFMRIAANVLRNAIPGASVTECCSFDEARQALLERPISLVVSGYGIGGGRSVKDLRMLTDAPIIVLTGRPEHEVDAPINAHVVQKDAGPGALTTAIHACMPA